MPKTARGFKAALMLGFEDSYGVTASPDGRMMPMNSCGLKKSRKLDTAATITGSRNPAAPFSGNTDLAGQIVVPVDLFSMGWWLKAMFGAPATAGTTTKTHTFTVADDQPSFWVETLINTDTPMFILSKGLKVAKFAMSVGGDNELVANIDVMGAQQLRNAASADATPTAAQFARLGNFQAAIKEGGATIGNCPAFSFTIDCGLDGDTFCIGDGGVRGDLPEGQLAVSGTLTTLLKDAALLDKALNGTETSLELLFTAGAHSLKFTFNEVQFEATSPVIEGPRGIRQEFNWQAYRDDHAANSAVVVELVNNIASY